MARTKFTPRKAATETRALREIRTEQRKTKPAISKIALARYSILDIYMYIYKLPYCLYKIYINVL